MDLHSGLPYWIIKNPLYDYYHPLTKDTEVEVAIIGSGITGSIVAHELCEAGYQCCIVDKRSLSTGSSIASTALLQYEIDVPLCEMIDKVGEENAVIAYRACLKSITDLENIFEQTGVDADFKRVPSIFFASDIDGLSLIKKEYKVRCEYNLPVIFMNKEQLFETFGFKAFGALVNYESAQMDAYKAAIGLLKYHEKKNSLAIYSHTEIVSWEECPDGYLLITSSGSHIKCKYLVIAAGFEAGKFLPKQVMQLTSTYALISAPVEPSCLWPEQALIWETNEPYLYIRTSGGNRIIVGGEDEEFSNPILRDELLREKTHTLEKKFSHLFPAIPFRTEMAWCGTFCMTEDGLPFIGKWPGKDRMYFDLGYGGNGITFSMIGAQLIHNSLQGREDPREQVFGFGRKNKKSKK